MLYNDLTLAAQAAFSGLDEAARQADLQRGVADVGGGFAKKTVSGRVYWYHQIKDANGKLSQTYIGPDDEATRKLIERHGDPTARIARQHLLKMARSAIELGCAAIPVKHARVIERLSSAGFFSAGGILVGTHAFLGYQNLYGVRWEAGAATLDLDFAHAGKNVSLALPENLSIDTPAAIESLQMGFTPNNSRTSFKKADEPDFDLDFLTSRGRGGDTPVHLARFHLRLQPLRFMELSLEDPIRSTMISRLGPVVVNMPRPVRYAMHKLIVSCERPLQQWTKARKDRAQAAALLSYLLEMEADEVASMWNSITTRGDGWRRRLTQGFEAMSHDFPNEDFPRRLAQALEAEFPNQADRMR